jgi:predicted nucleotidyltransferase
MIPDVAEQTNERPEFCEPFCELYGVSRLDLFGDAATEGQRTGDSGLSFLVEFQRFPPGPYADVYFGLLE